MQIRTRSLIIMFSQGLTKLTTIVLSIILVRVISKEMFGMYRQVFLVYTLLATALSLQLNTGFYYFVPKTLIQKRRTLILQTVLITLGLAFVIAVIMFTGARFIATKFDNLSLIPLIRILALYPFVERIIILVPAFMISIDKPLRAGIYTITLSAGRIAAVLITLALGYGLTEVMWAVVSITAIVAMAGCFDMARFCPVGKWGIDKNLVVEQFHYTWPLLAGMIAIAINVQLDKFLISVFFDTETYAVYSCGAMQLPVVVLVTSSLSFAMMPDLVRLFANSNAIDAVKIWQEAARKCSLILFPCFVFFFVTGFDFMVLLYGREYVLAGWPFKIYLFALPLKIVAYATLFRAAGKTKPIAYGAVIALIINAGVSISLVIIGKNSLLGFIGPAIGTVIATWCAWLYLLRKITRITSVTLDNIMRWKELGQILLVCIVCGAILALMPLPQIPLVVKIIVQAMIYFAMFLIIVLSRGMLKRDEKQILCFPFTFIQKLLRRRK